MLIPVTFTTPLLSQTLTTGKSFSFTTSRGRARPRSPCSGTRTEPRSLDATNTTYAITNTAFGDAGTYTLWATNSGATNSLSATVTVYSPFGYANVTNNLVLHLRFEGDTTDSSGRGNNGTPSSTTAPAFVPGIIGSQALQYTTETVNGQSGSNVTSASYVTSGHRRFRPAHRPPVRRHHELQRQPVGPTDRLGPCPATCRSSARRPTP